ncbi:TetR/AcrR family transcriptional regulator [Uliginosibacterium sediminicola]|uniref:TetR/AcrR family transcriptional regulator n=1 Tax=Uliginosibacterium sediminicola TaxID=2024550 RepID=A0ABU9YTK1_9RHOO
MDAILDAAAELVAVEGLAAVSMHSLARRARSSIGSLYHFFADREAVLNALRERHLLVMRQITQQLAQTPDALWQQYTAEAVILHLLSPYIAYIRAHADFLVLVNGRVPREDGADFVRTILHVLQLRLPALSSERAADYAAMLHAMAAGAMHVGFEIEPARAEVYMREIPRAMAAYLSQIEASLQADDAGIQEDGK